MAKKRPAAVQKKPASQGPPGHGDPECVSCPRTTCFCGNTIGVDRVSKDIVQCTIINSEGSHTIDTQSTRCYGNNCKTNYKPTFAWVNGRKINCLSYNDYKDLGFYMVTSKTGFSMKYLELTYTRLLRANLAPGAEMAVRKIVNTDDPEFPSCTEKNMRTFLWNALSGFAITKRSPNAVVRFDLDDPCGIMPSSRGALIFPQDHPTDTLCFDGHFGVHRMYEEGVDAPRTVALKGRPKKRKYKEHVRTSSCKHKDHHRLALPNRTAGWQFVLDAKKMEVLCAYEHITNETTADKVVAVKGAMDQDNVEATGLVHDDMCHFEQQVMKGKDKSLQAYFKGIKHCIIDLFHLPNHKCHKKTWSRAEKKRFRGIRSSLCESFNNWIRKKNFFLNHLKPKTHRFWVEEAILFFNQNRASLNLSFTRRSTTSSRNISRRPAAAPRLRPAAGVRRRPAGRSCC